MTFARVRAYSFATQMFKIRERPRGSGRLRALLPFEARAELSAVERADHLAVLWFVAEAEHVPVHVMKSYISEARLMESQLYQSAMEKGGVLAEVRTKAQTISRILIHRMGAIDPAVDERIRGRSDLATLTAWYEEALLVVDADAARRLAEKILHAPLAATVSSPVG